MATKQTHKPAGAPTKGLKVISAREGFRRGGHAFGKEPRVVALSELTPEQAEAIREEPMLAVAEVDIEPVN